MSSNVVNDVLQPVLYMKAWGDVWAREKRRPAAVLCGRSRFCCGNAVSSHSRRCKAPRRVLSEEEAPIRWKEPVNVATRTRCSSLVGQSHERCPWSRPLAWRHSFTRISKVWWSENKMGTSCMLLCMWAFWRTPPQFDDQRHVIPQLITQASFIDLHIAG